jgi:hypothetical protein
MLAMTRESGSAIMAGTYTGMMLYDAVTRDGQIIDTIQLYGPGLGTRTGIWIHNGTNAGHTTGCILVGFRQNSSTGYLSSGARQRIIDLIESAALTGIANQIVDVLVGFEELPSLADYPEITVTVSWSRQALLQYALYAALRMYVA